MNTEQTSENIFMYILLLPYRFSNFSFATFPQFLWCSVELKILESLSGCLTVLCPIDFYWIFLFHFGSLWCSRIVMNFPRFFMRYSSRWNHSALTYQEQLSNLIKQIKFNLSETFPSTYINFGSYQLSSLLLLLEVSKNHYEQKNISVGGSEKHTDSLFRFHLRQTLLNLFGWILVNLSFETFIFSIGITLFIRHSIVFLGIFNLLDQFQWFRTASVQRILKDRQLYYQKNLKYWALCPIIAQTKQIKIQDMALTRIRLLLLMEVVYK